MSWRTFAGNLKRSLSTMWGYYQGGMETERRATINRSVTDFRFDSSTMDLDSLVGASRWLAVNNPYYSQILNVIQLLTVGPKGLQIIPNCKGDPRFNEIAKQAWDEFCQNGDIGSNLPFEHSQSICSTTMARDGNAIALLCEDKGIPKIQWIEYHRIRGFGESKGNLVCDGIELNQFGKPQAYYVRAKLNKGDYRRVPARNIIHFFDPSRFGQHFGLPICTPVINDLIDLTMLHDFVMDREKYMSSRIGFFETPGGNKIDFGRLRAATLGGGSPTTQQPFGLSEEEKIAIRKSVGATVAFVPQGSKFTDVRSDTPSVNTLNFFDHILTKIMCGCAISKQFVSPVSMQGTVARIDVEICNASLLATWAILAAGFKKIYAHAISKCAQYTTAPDWDACTVQQPRSISADLKYEMEILIDGLKYGLFSWEDVVSRFGSNPEDLLNVFDRENQNFVQRAKAAGVAVPEYLSRHMASLGGNMPAQAQQEVTQNKEEEK